MTIIMREDLLASLGSLSCKCWVRASSTSHVYVCFSRQC